MNYNDKNKKGEYTLTSNFYKKIVFLRFFWFLANIKNIGKFKRSDFSYFPSINSYYILPLKSPKKIFLQKTRFKFTLLYFGYLRFLLFSKNVRSTKLDFNNNLADHWEKIRSCITIITKFWKKKMAERGWRELPRFTLYTRLINSAPFELYRVPRGLGSRFWLRPRFLDIQLSVSLLALTSR